MDRRLIWCCLGLGLLMLAAPPPAQASHLFCDAQSGFVFCEDFEGYGTGSSTYNGIPLVSEGANETWYGGRFEPWDGGTIHQDTVVRYLPGSFPDHQHYARLEDDAGILLNVSTLGYSDISISFDWRTHSVSSADRLVVGYFVGDLDFVNDSPDSPQYEDRVHNFWTDGPSWSSGGWVEQGRFNSYASWTNETFSLPAGEESVWFAFWIDNGEHDYGKIDNVLITGTGIVPEPSTAVLLVLTLAGLRRRR